MRTRERVPAVAAGATASAVAVRILAGTRIWSMCLFAEAAAGR